MVSYTEKEQEEIINEFLTVIDVYDKKRFIKNDIEICKKCKFNYGNVYMYKSLPSDIAKNICKFNYNECNKCKKLKNIVGYVDKHNIEYIDKIIEVLNEKENIEINGDMNDDIFIYVNLVKYPTYNKIFKNFRNRLYEHEMKYYYDKKMHKELKTYYHNLWRNKKSSIENYYDKLRFRYVKEFDDNINEYDNSRGGLIDFIKSKFSVIEKIVNIIFDIITDCSLETLLVKHNIITLNVKFMLSRFTDVDKDGFDSNDFRQYLDKRFPYVKKKTYNDYLKDASDFN